MKSMNEVSAAWMLATLVTLPVSALAQQRDRFNGFEPYEFGVSIDTARATAPAAQWQIDPPLGRSPSMNLVAGGPRLVLADIAFDVKLEFLDQELTAIHFSNSGAAGSFEPCAEDYRRLLAVVAARTGPIDSSVRPGPMVYGSAGAIGVTPDAATDPVQPQRIQLSDGSAIWRYDRPGIGPSDYRSQKQGDGLAVYLRAHWEQGKCLLSGSVANTALQHTISERNRLALEAAKLVPPPPPSDTDVARIRSAQEIDFARVRFTRTPTAAEVQAAFPSLAARRLQEGSAKLTCLLQVNGALLCVLETEEPAGWGFGSAALALANIYRTNPAKQQVGKRFEFPFRFKVP